MNTVIKTSLYQNGTHLDKNGLPSVFLSAVAGKFPRSLSVISGTHAQLVGIEPDKTYLANINELPGVNEYETHDGNRGKSKNWSIVVVGEPTMMEVVQMGALIGESEIIDDVVIGTVEDIADNANDESKAAANMNEPANAN